MKALYNENCSHCGSSVTRAGRWGQVPWVPTRVGNAKKTAFAIAVMAAALEPEAAAPVAQVPCLVTLLPCGAACSLHLPLFLRVSCIPLSLENFLAFLKESSFYFSFPSVLTHNSPSKIWLYTFLHGNQTVSYNF